jgi:hypothetical protein
MPPGAPELESLRKRLGPRPTLEARLDLLSLVQVRVDTPTGPQLVPLVPTPKQREALAGRDHRGREVKKHLYSGAIQVGKSILVAMQVFSRLPWIDLAWLVGGRFEDGRAEMELLADWLLQIGCLGNTVMPKGGDAWEIETHWGATIRTLSSSKPERLSSKKPDIIALCEAGQQTVEAYLTAYARAAPRDALLILAGTQENVQPWFSDMYDRWRLPNDEKAMAWTIAAWDNLYIYPGGRHDPKIVEREQNLPRRTFEARFAGTRPRPQGLVYDEFEPDRHVKELRLGEAPEGIYGVPTPAQPDTIWLPRDTPVQPWIDPGTGQSAGASAYAVLAAALYANRVYILDEIYVHGMLDEEVISIAQSRPWWAQVGADGRKLGVIDIAGTQQHGSATNLAVWRKVAGLQMIAQRVLLQEGENRVRHALKPQQDGWPDLFLSPLCIWGQREATRLYRYPTDDKGEAISPRPIDRDNHFWKAAAYGLYAMKGPTGEPLRRRRKPVRRPTPWAYLDDRARYGLRVVQ